MIAWPHIKSMLPAPTNPMTSCLFVAEDWPLNRNAVGGAPALILSHLELLLDYGVPVHLLLLCDARDPKGFNSEIERNPSEWEKLRSRLAGFTALTIVSSPDARESVLSYLTKPEAVLFHSGFLTEARNAIRELIEKCKPTFIWAEHLAPAVAALGCAGFVPVVYGHHDWRYKIKRLRSSGGFRKMLSLHVSRRVEMAAVKQAAACVSGSSTEAAEIGRITGKSARYFPAIYEPPGLDLHVPVSSDPRIVHLGGMATTANREGLYRFLTLAWPEIAALPNPPELWVVGSLKGAGNPLEEELRKANAVCTGFVEHLEGVLRPYDIHIVPWEHDTGTRTRVPLAMGYAQVVAAVRAGVQCIAEMRSGENCLLAESVKDMVSQIQLLLGDEVLRGRIGVAARQTFQDSFSKDAMRDQFGEFVLTLSRVMWRVHTGMLAC